MHRRTFIRGLIRVAPIVVVPGEALEVLGRSMVGWTGGGEDTFIEAINYGTQSLAADGMSTSEFGHFLAPGLARVFYDQLKHDILYGGPLNPQPPTGKVYGTSLVSFLDGVQA